MTHGEKQGLAALAIVLALILGAIWWSNRPTAAPVPAELPPVAASAPDSALTAAPDSTATPESAAKPSARKRSRRSPAPSDRPSPIDRPMLARSTNIADTITATRGIHKILTV